MREGRELITAFLGHQHRKIRPDMTTFNATRMTLSTAAVAALATLLVGAAAAQPAAAPSTVPPADAVDGTIDEVVVSGERAGPGLWKIRKGDHTLYLLATITPAPKKMEWRSREVESVLARAQAFVPARPEVDTDIGPI
ncbi:MAG: hypothetical protein ACKO7G_00100, partial [Gammaproteobacteria bacterium]